MKYRTSKDELIEAVKNSFSIAEVCRQLNIRPSGGNYKTIKDRIKSDNVDDSHFTGQGWNVGLKFRPTKPIILSEILVENSTYKNSNNLRIKLLNEGIKEKKCEICENEYWLNKPIKLELHHKNGVNTDNRIENLQILCPNCHSMTDTFRKGNSALADKRKDEYNKVKEMLKNGTDLSLQTYRENIKINKENIKLQKEKPKRYCLHCNNELDHKTKKYCSQECYFNSSKGNRPNVLDLIEKIKELKHFTTIGKYYNVSDNAVRKWCKLYGILEMIKMPE